MRYGEKNQRMVENNILISFQTIIRRNLSKMDYNIRVIKTVGCLISTEVA